MRTLFSGISRGTERLVFNGARRPERVGAHALPNPGGRVSFPGQIRLLRDRRRRGRAGRAASAAQVFCLHPHQDFFNAPVDALVPVPDGVPARRATLAANMETALNALWDGGAGPGDRIVVVGAGVVGLLVASLAARLPGAEVTAVDSDESRRPAGRGPGRRVCARPSTHPPMPTSCSTPAPPRGPQHRHQLRGVRGHHRRDELVRRASRCRSISAARSTAAA